MRFLITVSMAAALVLFTPIHDAVAQSPEFSVPLAVIKDADNKVLAQVIGFWVAPDSSPVVKPSPLALFEINGISVLAEVSPQGFRAIGGVEDVKFSGSDCSGNPYLNEYSPNPGFPNQFMGTVTVIVGPSGDTGEYRVFQSTSASGVVVSLASRLTFGGACVNNSPYNGFALPAQEVLPNPLEGFHGPTTANPERVLTIEGGTRLP